MDTSQIVHFRGKLEAWREELLDDIVAGSDASHAVELDQTRQGRLSRMDAMQQQAMAQATDRRRETDLKRIAAALQRIDDEEYGECLECGETIPVGRLEIDPALTLCVVCAEKREQSE